MSDSYPWRMHNGGFSRAGADGCPLKIALLVATANTEHTATFIIRNGCSYDENGRLKTVPQDMVLDHKEPVL